MSERVYPDGALLYSFDDTSVPEWVDALPLFLETGARVTFFVTRPDEVIAAHSEGLRALVAAGHAIGCHGLRHLKAVDSVAEFGMDGYLERDVLPAVACLRAAGFTPTAFAYPCSQNNKATDDALLQHFRYLRTGRIPHTGKRLCDMDELFVPFAAMPARACLAGTGTDYAGMAARPDMVGQACEAIDRARATASVLALYAHNISDSAHGHRIPIEALRAILIHARAVDLPAITFDNLCAGCEKA